MKLTYRLNKNPEYIYEYLTDMQKFASVHPIISQINSLENETYLVHETLKILSIPFTFTYPVTIEKNFKDKTVCMRATVFKLTKIQMNFTLTKDSDYTLVEEEIHFKSTLPVKFFMRRIFRKQHEILFKNIDLS